MTTLSRFLAGIIPLFFLNACLQEENIPVQADFSFVVADAMKTAPATVTLINTTAGADSYQWTFEGATPISSNKKDPGPIVYHKAGTYKIRLAAWNDHEQSERELMIQIDSAVALDFATEILVNDFAPATVNIINHTNFNAPHEWTFEGGSPASSTEAHPGQVVFTEAGEHRVTLKIVNGSFVVTSTQIVSVKPPLTPDFTIEPVIEDLDYEAPLRANLQNTTVSGLTYEWKSSAGGVIAESNATNTTVQFNAAGTYTVTLTASNGKETKSASHEIVVKPNSNLYTLTNVKFGVSAAHNTIGCFYASSQFDVVTSNEISDGVATAVTFGFYAINSSFDYCRFIAPSKAEEFGFAPVPSATQAWFVNVIENTSLVFSEKNFTDMVTDAPLKSLSIKSNDTGTAHFTNDTKPRVVLFETQDGRKGAMLLKAFVANGTESYVLADLKIQKAKS